MEWDKMPFQCQSRQQTLYLRRSCVCGIRSITPCVGMNRWHGGRTFDGLFWSAPVACSRRMFTNTGDPMGKSIRLIVFAVAAFSVFGTGAWAQQLNVGDTAPDFTLQASDGQTYTLSKLKGKTVVLAWFPKAFTAG